MPEWPLSEWQCIKYMGSSELTMAYYAIPNQIAGKIDYVVPNQAHVDLLSSRATTNSVTIGDQTLAAEILARNRAEYLPTESHRFHVHKIVDIGGVFWTSGCDLDQEPPNDDVVYGIYHVIRNEHIQAVGLAAALAMRTLVQDAFLATVFLDAYQTLTYIPVE